MSQNRFERGFGYFVRENPTYLPLPFPRFLAAHHFNERGLLKFNPMLTADSEPNQDAEAVSEKKDDFVTSIPMITRLAHDAAY